MYNNQSERLSEEHVIPFALGGELVILEASCQACQRIINETFEQRLITKTFATIRFMVGLPSRDKGKSPKHTKVTHIVDGEEKQIVTSPDKAIAPFYTFVLEPPDFGLFPIPESRSLFKELYFLMMHGDRTDIKARFQLKWKDLEVQQFGRLLAKIAHGFAIANKQFELFEVEPVLPPLILGQPSELPLSYLVGGLTTGLAADATDPSEVIHVLECSLTHTKTGTRVLVTKIQLFGNMGAPSYVVITGLEAGWQVAAQR